ncbi:hypothetical protein SCHPADRAFT_840734 [Schizopora paradoxa]|uniref:DUF6589 domain-containing protein n=1 Tax=Schizopora paradoxa TaxID=27342 RepID=A0A0H2RHK0_9AGAM|nr:hypothetical protein SCHPADRAFT_840734 [Schizopora paradoxa]
MELSNSKVDGNIATIETLLRQGGVYDVEKFAKQRPEISNPEDHFIFFHGDLGTGDRIQTAQLRRSLEKTIRLRLQNVIFIPGLFHIKMACADGIWRIFLEPREARSDETSFFSLLPALRPGDTSKIAGGTCGYQILNESIIHIGRAERLGWWEKIIEENVPGCKTLDEFAEREPSWDAIEKLAVSLAKHVSSKRLREIRKKPDKKRDYQYENTLRRTQYFLLYEETAHSIRSGDVGRVETCLRKWIPIFKGVGKHKYAAMLLQFLTDVHFVYPPSLSKSIRYNWFCNISGKEMKCQGQDWLVELNNWLTKGIYGGHGSNNTVDRVVKESVLIQLFRDIICIIERQFGINPKLTRHGEPDMRSTYTELRRLMRESNMFNCMEGRKTAHLIRDAVEAGMYRFASESSAQADDILDNSNESEQAVTEEDIIMESVI